MRMPLNLLLNRRKLLTEPKRLGRWGERTCEKFLKRRGLKTLTRNFSCKAGEIDRVMVDTDRSIVFVEVKTRAREDFTPTESVVTKSKMDKLAHTARYFLALYDIENRPYRFDVVTIILNRTGRPKITLYKNAFVR